MGAALAGRAIAAELQRTGGLTARPDVAIGGFPFLTQAVGGRYRDISVDAAAVPAGEVVLQRLTARLVGAEVPLADALSGSVDAVPVERIDAQVLLSYDDLARRAGDRSVTLAPQGDLVRVRGSVRFLGQELAATAVSRISVEAGEVVVTAQSYEVGNAVANGVLTGLLRDRLDFRFRLGALPYGLAVDGVDVRPDGVAVSAAAADTVLTAR